MSLIFSGTCFSLLMLTDLDASVQGKILQIGSHLRYCCWRVSVYNGGFQKRLKTIYWSDGYKQKSQAKTEKGLGDLASDARNS